MAKETYIKKIDRSHNMLEVILAKMQQQELNQDELRNLVRLLIPSQEPEHFYTEKEAAQILSISEKQVYNLRIGGKIHFREIGSSIRYAKSDIVEFQDSCRRRNNTQEHESN